MIIAIDGPSGSGKSTVARAIAEKMNITYLDTGAMYRAITWWCLSHNISPDNPLEVCKAAETLEIDMSYAHGVQTVCIEGQDITSLIRSADVDAHVSQFAAIADLRKLMLKKQRAYGQKRDIVAEGRDIGTAVFPNAQVKIFLTADARARAHRRCVERHGGDEAQGRCVATSADEEEAILNNLLERDKIDSTRDVTPLKQAQDAFFIDSSHMSVEEIVDVICARAKERVCK